ncbi:hypothetical protein JCM16814_21780 [Desulfobaculum senezii]
MADRAREGAVEAMIAGAGEAGLGVQVWGALVWRGRRVPCTTLGAGRGQLADNEAGFNGVA